MDEVGRFWTKVIRASDGGCWLWKASRSRDGYGRFGVGGRRGKIVYAHRFAYEITNGPIAEGMVLDHLCRVVACVNPAHLEVVTNRTNILRGISPAAKNLVKTHCKRGHALTRDNLTKYGTKIGRRNCRRCHADYQQRYRPTSSIAATRVVQR